MQKSLLLQLAMLKAHSQPIGGVYIYKVNKDAIREGLAGCEYQTEVIELIKHNVQVAKDHPRTGRIGTPKHPSDDIIGDLIYAASGIKIGISDIFKGRLLMPPGAMRGLLSALDSTGTLADELLPLIEAKKNQRRAFTRKDGVLSERASPHVTQVCTEENYGTLRINVPVILSAVENLRQEYEELPPIADIAMLIYKNTSFNNRKLTYGGLKALAAFVCPGEYPVFQHESSSSGMFTGGRTLSRYGLAEPLIKILRLEERGEEAGQLASILREAQGIYDQRERGMASRLLKSPIHKQVIRDALEDNSDKDKRSK